MAAYDTLRAAIDNYIKANGNKEITGTVLNDILNAMVSALGADTRFAGVAVPITNPGNPEGNVVYFASQAGTYSNFGGIVLPLGIHILVWNGTAWTSQTWFSVDNTPTQNSQNLATSGGILQAIVDAVGMERLRAIGAEVTSCSFDGTTKKISFFNSANTTLFQLDATAFVIDGMVSDVKIEDGNLVIQFNTDAGKQDIEIPLTDIFNPANYYTKTAIDELLALYYTKTETDALLTVINNKLADGYLYKGMAEPTTNPPTPTTKVFYIATKAGTYTNFGNIAVSEGITILKYDGSNWSKEQISYSDGVFDISAYNGTSYADLSAALGTNGANIPQNLRKGGMSVKFVLSSDNKYIQARLMADSFTTNTTNWQVVTDELKPDSKDIASSGGVFDLKRRVLDNASRFGGDLSDCLIDGYYIVTNASVGAVVDITAFTTANNYKCGVFTAKKGDSFTLTGEGGGGPRLWALLDADCKLVACGDRYTKDYVEDIPQDGILVVNFNVNFETPWSISKSNVNDIEVNEKLNTAQTDINAIKNELNPESIGLSEIIAVTSSSTNTRTNAAFEQGKKYKVHFTEKTTASFTQFSIVGFTWAGYVVNNCPYSGEDVEITSGISTPNGLLLFRDNDVTVNGNVQVEIIDLESGLIYKVEKNTSDIEDLKEDVQEQAGDISSNTSRIETLENAQIDQSVISGSTKPVSSGAVYNAIQQAQIEAAQVTINTGLSCVTVASSEASQAIKAACQYVCDGTSDEAEINAAIAALPQGGRVQLTRGRFNISSPITIGNAQIDLCGEGAYLNLTATPISSPSRGGTILQAVDNIDVVTIDSPKGAAVHDLAIFGYGRNNANNTGMGIKFIGFADITRLYNLSISNCCIGIGSTVPTDILFIFNNSIQRNALGIMLYHSKAVIHDNIFCENYGLASYTSDNYCDLSNHSDAVTKTWNLKASDIVTRVASQIYNNMFERSGSVINEITATTEVSSIVLYSLWKGSMFVNANVFINSVGNFIRCVDKLWYGIIQNNSFRVFGKADQTQESYKAAVVTENGAVKTKICNNYFGKAYGTDEPTFANKYALYELGNAGDYSVVYDSNILDDISGGDVVVAQPQGTNFDFN